jgi:hypothetical protein
VLEQLRLDISRCLATEQGEQAQAAARVVYAAKDKSLEALKKCFGITKVFEY